LGSRCHGLKASQAASVVNLIEGELGHKQALVRFAAAYVQGRVDAVGELAAGVLTALLTKPGAVPEAWGWYGADAKPIRLSLAVTAVLRVSRIAEPQPLLAPLLKSKRPKVRGELIAYAGLISHLAFASAASLTQAGVVAHGLSATQRAVLQLFAQREFQGIVPSELGLPSHHNSDIKAFLAQKELSWCPIAVSSTEKRHFANILGGVIVGEVDGNMSLDAICKALEPKQVAMLACSHSTATMAMNETLGDRMDWRLSTEFCFELITRAHSAGLDIKALLKPALSPRGNEPWSKGGLFLNRTLAAAALLTFGAKSPPSSPELELIADGISAARVPEPLLTQVAQLPDKLRGPLVEGLTVSSNSLPFMKTWVSERSVEKIARFALRAFTPAEKQLAERTLVELGKGALPLLDRFEPKVGSDRRSLEGLRTRIVDALAKGKAPKAKVKTTKAKVKRGKGKPS
ncbi:MAG: hypothetical protein KC492_08405, partial [Myxococcales bacterium]|nr:hypothetical protein [Myxococcales bacterium]